MSLDRCLGKVKGEFTGNQGNSGNTEVQEGEFKWEFLELEDLNISNFDTVDRGGEEGGVGSQFIRCNCTYL